MVGRERERAYTIEKNSHVAVGVNGGLVATKLCDFTNDADVLVDEGVEARRSDAWGGNVFRHDESTSFLFCFGLRGESFMICVWHQLR